MKPDDTVRVKNVDLQACTSNLLSYMLLNASLVTKYDYPSHFALGPSPHDNGKDQQVLVSKTIIARYICLCDYVMSPMMF